MKPFTITRPTSLTEALNLMAQGDRGIKVIAGGQSLLLAMKSRTLTPHQLIDISNIPKLDAVRFTDDGVEIGATVTYTKLSQATLVGWHKEVVRAAGDLADRSVRNIGTVGGSVCQADSRFDMAAILKAVNAQFILATTGKVRNLTADEFFLPGGGTALKSNELLTSIILPQAARWNFVVFEKFRRRVFEAALVSVCLAVALDDQARVSEARLVIGGIGGKPFLLAQAIGQCVGNRLVDLGHEDIARNAAYEVLRGLDSPGDFQTYQFELVISLVQRAFRRVDVGMS